MPLCCAPGVGPCVAPVSGPPPPARRVHLGCTTGTPRWASSALAAPSSAPRAQAVPTRAHRVRRAGLMPTRPPTSRAWPAGLGAQLVRGLFPTALSAPLGSTTQIWARECSAWRARHPAHRALGRTCAKCVPWGTLTASPVRGRRAPHAAGLVPPARVQPRRARLAAPAGWRLQAPASWTVTETALLTQGWAAPLQTIVLL